MMAILLHPSTETQIQNIINDLPHAVILIGADGAGKGTVAFHIASNVLGIETDKLRENGFVKHISPIKLSIPIESIRELQQFTKLRTTGSNSKRRLILIEQAHTLTAEAQNAFLKLLEEPPADTLIIMTVVGEHSLLPTIYSRTQKVHIQAPHIADIINHFETNGHAASEIQKAYFMSDGMIGLMSALLQNDQEHPLVNHIAQAKELLTKSKFERVSAVDAFAKQKDDLPDLLSGLQRVVRAALKQTADKHGDITPWHDRLKHVQFAQQALALHAQPKLLLTDLFLAL